MLGADGHEARWRVGCMAALSGHIHPTVCWETELLSAGRHFMELDLRREPLKDLSSLACLSDLSRSRARSLDTFPPHHEAVFGCRGIIFSYDMFAALLTRIFSNNIGHLQREKRTVRPQIANQISENRKILRELRV